MDEDYRMLQSDLLCFYQSSEDETIKEKPTYTKNAPLSLQPTSYANQPDTDKIRYRDRTVRPICVPINFEDDEPTDEATKNPAEPTPTAIKPDVKTEPNAKPEHIKNEVIFKSIFGATKNAIFRTAQSIIENHEKKNLAKKDSAVTTPTGQDPDVKQSSEFTKKKDFFTLKPCSNKNKVSAASTPETITPSPDVEQKVMPKSLSAFSLGRLVTAEKGRVPGVVKCVIKSTPEVDEPLSKVEKGSHGLLRFFESPIFNIHFALHYLFYSKEPGVLSFIGNKVFSFKDNEVDLYIPQLILMYIQMDELAEVLDPYLVYRCRRTADFSLKCSWLLEAYNYSADSFAPSSNLGKKAHLMLMRELYPRKVKRDLRPSESLRERLLVSPSKKTHHRSHSDATGLLNGGQMTTLGAKVYQAPVRLCLGDLSTGRAFDNGCTCFETVRGAVNGLLGQKTVCSCGVGFFLLLFHYIYSLILIPKYSQAPKLAPQKEFMKSLVDIGKNLTSLPTKTEKTSILRMRLNLINKNLPARVWLPLNSDVPHHVVRITEEKTAVLNSKDKTPYIIYVEVVEVGFLHNFIIIMKRSL